MADDSGTGSGRLVNISINLGPVGDAAKLAIEKISQGIAAVTRGPIMVRDARAEVERARTLASGALDLADIDQRAAQRLLGMARWRQENLEAIASASIEYVGETVSPTPLNPDWTARYVSRAENVSDATMRAAWARVLASEVTAPGSLSIHTLDVLGAMAREDAEAFTRLCAFLWQVPLTGLALVVPSLRNEDISIAEVRYQEIVQLDALGLLRRFTSLTGRLMAELGRTDCDLLYFGQHTRLRHASETDIELGCMELSRAGYELATIAEPRPNAAVREVCLNFWAARGWKQS